MGRSRRVPLAPGRPRPPVADPHRSSGRRDRSGPRPMRRGLRFGASRRPGMGRITVVAEDNVWLARSWSAAGELVDDPPRRYRIPLDVAAVDPATFAPFLPPADRATLAAIENGEGILGSTSASVRRLGPGGLLELGGGTRIRVAAVLPDELVGAAELLVSRQTGRRIGVTRDRYLLIRPAIDGPADDGPAAGGPMTSATLR